MDRFHLAVTALVVAAALGFKLQSLGRLEVTQDGPARPYEVLSLGTALPMSQAAPDDEDVVTLPLVADIAPPAAF